MEVMACPSGCLNGGGQLPPAPARAPGARLDKVGRCRLIV